MVKAISLRCSLTLTMSTTKRKPILFGLTTLPIRMFAKSSNHDERAGSFTSRNMGLPRKAKPRATQALAKAKATPLLRPPKLAKVMDMDVEELQKS